MLEIDRFEKILFELNTKKRISYLELEKIINVSSSTVRRDIEKLYSRGLLTKIKGGISVIKKSNSDKEVKYRFSENINEKKKIALNTIKLINEGDFIFLDAGTTTYHLIELLKNKSVTVVTNGIMHIEELLKNNVETILLGGKIKKATGAIVGSEALVSLEKYNFDKCFLGVNGISLKNGFTTPEINEALLKQKVIELSREKYILADRKKFNKISNIKFSDLDYCKIITTTSTLNENKEYKKYIYQI